MEKTNSKRPSVKALARSTNIKSNTSIVQNLRKEIISKCCRIYVENEKSSKSTKPIEFFQDLSTIDMIFMVFGIIGQHTDIIT